MLALVVTNPFGSYPRGAIITNPTIVSAIRAGEDVGSTVLVSDQAIPPPVAPPAPNFAALQQSYLALTDELAAQRLLLLAAQADNTAQSQTIAQQAALVAQLTAAVNLLEARISNPNSGPGIPHDTSDDVPLTENDGDILTTDADVELVGDIR